jgi:hypothetical protein
MGAKITKFIRFFNPKWEQNVGLIPNPNHEARKTKKKETKTWHVQNNNPTRFYCKIEIEQGCDKKTYLKLVLNN